MDVITFSSVFSSFEVGFLSFVNRDPYRCQGLAQGPLLLEDPVPRPGSPNLTVIRAALQSYTFPACSACLWPMSTYNPVGLLYPPHLGLSLSAYAHSALPAAPSWAGMDTERDRLELPQPHTAWTIAGLTWERWMLRGPSHWAA